MLSSNNARFE